jgi:hypothetical protein
MAMKTASPWWFSAIFAAGLFLIFLGERPFGHIDGVRLLFTGLGALLVVATTALRVWTFTSTSGERRAVERILLMCHAGVLFSLLIYTFTTQTGQGLVGVDALDAKAQARYVVPMTLLWAIGMLVSLVPLLMVELSLGTARRSEFSVQQMRKSDIDEEAVESFRVREMSASGLTIALAAALLMVTCNVASQRNIRKDVSYFKTSSPGSATVNIARSVSEPIKILLFFPKVNEVKNEVRGYFESLRDAAGNVEIEEHDRMLSAALAKQYRVNVEGTVVIVHGDRNENLVFTVDADKVNTRSARTELRQLDGKVNTALMKVVRTRRVAYVTVGHGELGDADSLWERMGLKASEVKRRLRDLNYQVKDLGVAQGLGNEVPDDANMVIILGPREDLLDEEQDALDRYLARGGRLLIALDPVGNATLGKLQGRLGVSFDRTPITDDERFMAQTRTIRDRRLIITDRFSSHASNTTLSRAPSRHGMVFIEAGSLRETEFADGMPKAKRTYVIRTMPSAFADTNNNFTFDKETETRAQYNLAAAIEDPTSRPAPEGKHPVLGDEGMRAMVFSDVHIFADAIMIQLGGAQAMFDDAIKWLGGEESLAGEVVSEEDVYIEHTHNEDVLWFYSTIVGAPLLVLAFGLWFGLWRRSRIQRRSA